MKRLIATLAGILMFLPAAAWGFTPAPEDQQAINRAARWMSNNPAASVHCEEVDEPWSPDSIGAWAYVILPDPTIHFDADLCRSLVAILHHKPDVSWREAVAALVLTHEAFHLRENMGNRRSEAATECRAIRHTRYMMLYLGLTPDEVERLMPYALASHYRIGVIAPRYNAVDCGVPWYWT